jgi:translocation and assembly module TamB
MKRALRWLIVASLLGAVAGGLNVLLRTEMGLRWAFHFLQTRVPGHLAVERINGRLVGPILLTNVHYDGDSASITAAKIAVDWQPLRLAGGSLHVSGLAIERLDVAVRAAVTPRSGVLPSIRLPIAIGIEQMTIHTATVRIPGHETLVIDDLRLSGIARDAEVSLAELHAEGPSLLLDAKGHIPLSETAPLDARADLDMTFDGRRIQAQASAMGTARRARIEFTLVRPVSLKLRGEIDRSEKAPQWRFTAAIEPFALQDLIADARPVRSTGAEIEVHGRGIAFEASGRLGLRDTQLGDWLAQFDGRWGAGRWEISRLVLSAESGAARIEASAGGETHHLEKGPDRLQASWQALGWPIRRPAIRSSRGRLSASGSLDDYSLELEGELEPPGTPALTLRAGGRGNRDEWHLATMNARWLGGDWTGSGLIAWRAAPRWQASLEARGVDLSAFSPALSSALDATVRGSGSLTADLGTDVRFERITGTLRGLAIDANGALAYRDGILAIPDFSARSGSASLRADARIGAQWKVDWQLQAGRLSDLIPGMEGGLRLSGTLDNPSGAPRAQVHAAGDGLSYRQARVDSFRLSASVDLAPDGQWKGRIEGKGLDIAGTDIPLATLAVEGTSRRHALVLRVEGADALFEQRVDGSLSGGRWRATLHHGRFRDPRLGVWQQRNSSAAFIAGDGSFSLADYCLLQQNAFVCARASRNPRSEGEAALSWKEIDLARFSPVLHRFMTFDVTGIAAGALGVNLTHGGPRGLHLDLTARDGALRYLVPGQKSLHLMSYRTVTLSATATAEQGLRSVLEIRLTNSEMLSANLELPGWNPATLRLAEDQPVTGRLGCLLKDTAIISLIVPDLSASDGSLRAQLTLSGTVGSPRIDGEIHLEVSKLALPRFGTRIEAVHMQAAIAEGRVGLKGTARIGRGTLRLEGGGTIESLGQWRATLHLAGEDLEAIQLPLMQIVASPDVTLRFEPQEIVVSGSITVPLAKIDQISGEATVTTSSDVIVVGERPSEAPSPPIRLRGSLEILFGDSVKISARGLDGRLTGRLLLAGDAQGTITAQGEVQLVEGRYRAYGQNLTIKQGRLLYAGGPVDDPALNIVASRQRGGQNEIEVGVRVMGTAKKPEVSLYSSPVMDDADALSYLILGRPMNQIREGEGQKLYQAANSVALVGGEALAQKVAERFNLEVSVETDQTAAQTEQTELVIGRAISPRLYLRYLQGIQESGSAFQLRYKLSEQWMIQTESGTRTGAGGDLLYIFEH